MPFAQALSTGPSGTGTAAGAGAAATGATAGATGGGGAGQGATGAGVGSPAHPRSAASEKANESEEPGVRRWRIEIGRTIREPSARAQAARPFPRARSTRSLLRTLTVGLHARAALRRAIEARVRDAV